MKYALVLLLVSYLIQLCVGTEVAGLTDDQMTKLRQSLVTAPVTDKLIGEFNVVWAYTGITQKDACAFDTYSVAGNVITKKVSVPKKLKEKQGKPPPPAPPLFTMVEMEHGVLESRISGGCDGDVAKLYFVYASANVLAFLDCKKDNGEETNKKHKRPLVFPFIQVRKGKSKDDADVKECYQSAKAIMDALGTEITNDMAMMTETC